MKNLHFTFIVALTWICTSLLIGYVFSITHKLDIIYMIFLPFLLTFLYFIFTT